MSEEHWSKKYLDDLNKKITSRNGEPKPVRNSANSANPPNPSGDRQERRGKRRRNRRGKNRPQERPRPQEVRKQLMTGTVVSVNGKVSVHSGGNQFECSVTREIPFPIVVGDRVQFARSQQGHTIEKIEPRQNYVVRPFLRDEKQETIQAANVNQVLIIVSAAEPVFRPDWLDRHLVICEKRGYKPILCCTKIDLANDNSFVEQLDVYRRMGYRVIYQSLFVEPTLTDVRNLFRGKTTLVTGPTGCGKTTLIQHLMPPSSAKEESALAMEDEYVPTQRVSAIRMDPHTWIIDTPGITEFEIACIQQSDLRKYFRDFRRLPSACESPYCSHHEEENCGVRLASERGDLAEDRYRSYLKILEQLQP